MARFRFDRRALLGGAALGGLLVNESHADTAFSSFSFTATGAPTAGARTMPVRLSDVVNVKDWGAVGLNTGDDSSAIQAAINYAIGPRSDGTAGGTVFFPPGQYPCSVPLTCGSATSTIRVDFIGAGGGGAVIVANSLSKGSNTYDNIGRVDGFIINSITLSGTEQIIENCRTIIDASNALGAYIANCAGSGGSGNPPNAGPAPASGPVAGTFFIALGSHCTAVDCRGQLVDVSFALSGYGPSILGCSAETNRTGARAGWAPSFTMVSVGTANSGTKVLTFASIPNSVIVGRYVTGTNIPAGTYITAVDQVAFTITLSANLTGNITAGTITFANETPAYGCTIASFETERNDYTIDLYNINGGLVTGGITQGQVGSDSTFAAISSITWSNVPPGTAHVTTTLPHNLASGTQILQIFSTTNNIVPSYGNPPGANGAGGFVIATRTGASTFDYDLSSDPGGFGTGNTWAYPQYYTMRCRKVHNTAIMGNALNVNAALATIDLEYSPTIGGTGEAQHSNNIMAGSTLIYGIQLPTTNPQNLAGWTFIGINGVVNRLEGNAGWTGVSTKANADGHMVFANLPGQYSNPDPVVYQIGPFETQEYSITDGAKSGGGSAAWNDIVQGSGSGHYLVRYDDGSNWRRIG